MKFLSLLGIFILVTLALASEEDRGPFCQKACLKILPPPGPPKSFTLEGIKKNDIETQKFLKCFSKCFALYVIDGNNENMQSKLKSSDFA